MDNELIHYGTPRHSGRYPYGSGENPYQDRAGAFLRNAKRMTEEGKSEKEIAESLNMSIREYRSRKTLATNEVRKANVALAEKLVYEQGMSKSAAARQMNVNESTLRSYLNRVSKERTNQAGQVANVLEEHMKKNPGKYIDISSGSEIYLGCSPDKLNASVQLLKDKGYTVHKIQVDQLGTAKGNKTTVKVLAPEGSTYVDVKKNYDKIIMPPGTRMNESTNSVLGIKKPTSISSDRIMVRDAEHGGSLKDGVIELRRGVKDISLGKASYAQVRIAVDGTHYLKGMAMYSDDMPKGVDVIFNSSKSYENKMDHLKKLKVNPETGKIDTDNPFGATVRQFEYEDTDGKSKLSAINIVNEEGTWDTWSRSLSSQMLSKQLPATAKRQLNLAYLEKKSDYEDLSKLTNPVVKEHLLTRFADECDSAAVHLKAAAMPRQASQVILPVTSLKDNEIYAPNFQNGETVVLIRYPHGGTFEIPQLKVNNKHKEAKALLGDAKDAVGINANVAERLSGADFDGDSVLVIPNNNGIIKTTKALDGLKNFDPKISYKRDPSEPPTSPETGFKKQYQMGLVSNLITDMTIKGADEYEIARAVRHSMVVIDAEKHNLNWQQSAIDNGIAELKEKYQGGKNRGASTLISRAQGEMRVPKRKLDYSAGIGGIDPDTGEKIYKETGETYTKTSTNRKGELVTKTYPVLETTTKMAATNDAYTLSSGTRMENIYADHANKLKALANEARKAAVSVDPFEASPSAKKVYATEVEELKTALKGAIMNRPLERQAQLLATATINAKKSSNPGLSEDRDALKKISNQALAEARARTGAGKHSIEITDRQWEAIQNRAVSKTVLREILNNTDLDKIKKLATPRESNALSTTKQARIRSMYANGATYGEIAKALGVSASTVSRYLS